MREIMVFFVLNLVSKLNWALICFGTNARNVCEIFTGSSNHGTYPSTYSHTFSGLAYYNGLPTTVGGGYPEANNKVETLSLSGWTMLPDHPKYEIFTLFLNLDKGNKWTQFDRVHKWRSADNWRTMRRYISDGNLAIKLRCLDPCREFTKR